MSRNRRRADAERNAAAILDAAADVLGQAPDAGVEQVAAAAGVSRQTVYAHFPTREALLAAVMRRITEETMTALAAAELDDGPATAALVRLLETGWQSFDRYPLLLSPAATTMSATESDELHEPVFDLLLRLIRRGQSSGEFDPDASPEWLLAATAALGHAAGAEVAAGRMPADEASAAVRRSVLRLFERERAGRTTGRADPAASAR
ncbi:TetR/AcrR family transcriptional regulator [Pseudonocardia sp. TRM90224]|uniref:TetR/AcrR family transcriptional regulator n=1 Tax=Pseudonocardia sp. TRM90224 TaxID=2812678 RepID=UPI001E3A62B6|nr:TetR/AcrR family transcriptional regulator [Pseudonocardia sp. TRM90224]